MGERQPDPEEGLVKYGDIPPVDGLRRAILEGSDMLVPDIEPDDAP